MKVIKLEMYTRGLMPEKFAKWYKENKAHCESSVEFNKFMATQSDEELGNLLYLTDGLDWIVSRLYQTLAHELNIRQVEVTTNEIINGTIVDKNKD